MALDKETEERIEQPVSEEAELDTRLTPAPGGRADAAQGPARGNRKLRTLLERVNKDKQLKAWWHVANVNAVARMQINDHSWVHVQIVTNIALKLLRQLTKHGVEPSLVTDYGSSARMRRSSSRSARCSTASGWRFIARATRTSASSSPSRSSGELLEGLYEEPELTVIASEALHAITSHREYGKPLTLEAGIVRVADALDMAKGRSRIPFERGRVSIHSLSAAAIDDVTIADGVERPIGIEITMNNSSGIYQVDELLGAKLRGSGLEPYVDVIAHIEGEAEKLPRSRPTASKPSRLQWRPLRGRLMVGRSALDRVV